MTFPYVMEKGNPFFIIILDVPMLSSTSRFLSALQQNRAQENRARSIHPTFKFNRTFLSESVKHVTRVLLDILLYVQLFKLNLKVAF